MGKGDLVDVRREGNRMDARNFADAVGRDFRLHAQSGFHQFSEALGRSGGRIELMDMMRFLHGGRIAVPLQHPAHLLHGGEEGIDPEGKVRCIDERRPGLFEGAEDIGLDVVPAGRAHHRGLEVLGNERVIGPEGIRPGKVDDDAFLRDRRVRAADVLARRDEFDPPPCQFLLDHMAHPAVSADDDFHRAYFRYPSFVMMGFPSASSSGVRPPP